MIKNSKIMNCKTCGREVSVRFYRQSSFKFCSRTCKQKRKNTIIVCQTCKKTFEIPISRLRDARHCSRECYYKSRRLTRINLVCEQCGKPFERKPHMVKEGQSKLCSIACRGMWHRISRKNGPQGIRAWMIIRGLIVRCNRCGYDEHPEILNVHHVDENRQNNNLENLEVLCPNCHALAHYKDSKWFRRLWETGTRLPI